MKAESIDFFQCTFAYLNIPAESYILMSPSNSALYFSALLFTLWVFLFLVISKEVNTLL